MSKYSNLHFLVKNNSPPELLVLLYSQRSEQCKAILSRINPAIISFFRMVCVDDPEIIATISSSETVKVSKLPCSLVLYRDEVMEVDLAELAHNIGIFLEEQSSRKNGFQIIDEDALSDDPPVIDSRNLPDSPSVDRPKRAPRQSDRVRQKPRVIKERVKEFEEQGISSRIIKPQMGKGHSRMGQSSLNVAQIDEDDEDDNSPQVDTSFLDDNLKQDFSKVVDRDKKKSMLNQMVKQAEAEREAHDKYLESQEQKLGDDEENPFEMEYIDE
jgi:hypothetical protein